MLREVIELAGIYAALSHPRTDDKLAAHYQTATECCRRATPPPREPERPISLLAAAVPVTANLDVAIHALHVLPPTDNAGGVDLQLIQRIREDSAFALNQCQRALELDGRSHGYRAGEWWPTVRDVANAITTAPRPDQEPPSIVSCEGRRRLASASDRRPRPRRRGLSRGDLRNPRPAACPLVVRRHCAAAGEQRRRPALTRDPQRPWIIIAQRHQTVALEDGASFTKWGSDLYPRAIHRSRSNPGPRRRARSFAGHATPTELDDRTGCRGRSSGAALSRRAGDRRVRLSPATAAARD
jgi:hypothetical protein